MQMCFIVFAKLNNSRKLLKLLNISIKLLKTKQSEKLYFRSMRRSNAPDQQTEFKMDKFCATVFI